MDGGADNRRGSQWRSEIFSTSAEYQNNVRKMGNTSESPQGPFPTYKQYSQMRHVSQLIIKGWDAPEIGN